MSVTTTHQAFAIGDVFIDADLDVEHSHWTVSVAGQEVGYVWQLHKTDGVHPHHRIPTGNPRSWAVEDVDGERNYARSMEEAIEKLLEHEGTL